MTTPSVAPPPLADEATVDGLPREGDILAGKYRIERVLGQGGMGLVVAAHHLTLRQTVAIKLLLPEAAKREEACERFLREARAAVSIQSQHVARVIDVGTLETGSPYMVMEFLTGRDLSAILAEHGPLPVADAVDFVLQACEAIAEAHSIGIIHRDLKPGNLFVTQRADGSPLVKVLDFGLSKITKPDALDASLTAHNVVMGSPCYMSPEQIKSLKGLDARTDIWALGVILYQLLTGARPFDAPSLGALFFTIGADPPVPLRQRRADIPPGLEAAVLKCLEKSAERRTQTIAELARALAPFGKETSRISVERIHRVLSDATPFPTRRPFESDAFETAGGTLVMDVDDNAATIARPLPEHIKESLRPPPPPALAPLPSTPPPPPLPRDLAYQAPATSAQVKSGSMAALAKEASGSMPPPPPTQHAPATRRSGLATAAIAVALVSVGAVGGLGLRSISSPPPPAPAAAPPPPAPAPPPVTAAVTASATATAAVTATASASAAAPPAPSTSASAAPRDKKK